MKDHEQTSFKLFSFFCKIIEEIKIVALAKQIFMKFSFGSHN
jgi:hypothetical protein